MAVVYSEKAVYIGLAGEKIGADANGAPAKCEIYAVGGAALIEIERRWYIAA